MTDQKYIDHGLSRQAVAAAELLRSLADDGSDLDFTHDVVEGETGLFEAVQLALNEIDEGEVVMAGCAAMVKTLQDRMDRTKRRSEKLRGLIDQAFQMANVKSHKFPTATISQKAVPSKLIVLDESAIPSEFFKPQPPKLDMAALKAAAKDRRVEGAEMSNGGTTIQIRRA